MVTEKSCPKKCANIVFSYLSDGTRREKAACGKPAKDPITLQNELLLNGRQLSVVGCRLRGFRLARETPKQKHPLLTDNR
jgi:hypothetical protein